MRIVHFLDLRTDNGTYSTVQPGTVRDWEPAYLISSPRGLWNSDEGLTTT